jgi:hypothetical protein
LHVQGEDGIIGTKYGVEAAQEWTSKKRIVSKEPKYSDAIEIRHTKRVQATKERSETLFSPIVNFSIIGRYLITI